MLRFDVRTRFAAGLLSTVVAMVLALGLASLLAVPAGAQSTPPLQYFKNYFLVGGDYVVGGWQKTTTTTLADLPYASGNTYFKGNISIPDGVQATALGVPASSMPTVPAGADIVAAFLYWQTVENNTTGPAGQKGKFNNFTITGTPLGNPTTPVGWSSGGCSGSGSTNKNVSTYRADVLRFLNIDTTTGKFATGSANYEADLADAGSNGNTLPLTLGATLVLVYRNVSSTDLNAVVFYDGNFGASNQAPLISQQIKGFYQPFLSSLPAASYTTIAGSGQTNKFENVTFGTSTGTSVPLPSLYPAYPNSPFPGVYNTFWDNPTWRPNSYGSAVVGNANAVSTATATITPAQSGGGCVTLGAMIFKTNVQDTDGDGLLDIWESQSGLQDPNGNPLPDIHAMNADPNVRDMFVQLDYMYSDGGSTSNPVAHTHLPSQNVLDMVGNAYKNAPPLCFNGVCKGINIHFDIGNRYQTDSYVIPATLAKGGQAILETACDPATFPCLFPDFDPTTGSLLPGRTYAGTLAWKLGYLAIKNGDPTAGIAGHFDPSRKDMFHYALFAHTLGLPRWLLTDKTLSSVAVSPDGLSATVTTALAHGLANGKNFISISGAPASANLDDIYTVDCSVAGTCTSNSFTVQLKNVSGTPGVTYDISNGGGLAVGNGIPRSTSGVSDVRGGDVMVSLGRWDNLVGSDFVQASTLMHELGHNLGLGHAGALSDTNNCKPNYPSIMSYLFQIGGLLDGKGFAHIDYSPGTLSSIDETNLNEPASIGTLRYLPRWYTSATSPLISTLGLNITPGNKHCDGTPAPDNPQNAKLVRVDGDSTMLNGDIDWNYDGQISATNLQQDVNFSGDLNTYGDFNDWNAINLRHLDGRSNGFAMSLDVGLNQDAGDGAAWGNLNAGGWGNLNAGGWGNLSAGGWGDPGIGSGALNAGGWGNLSAGGWGNLSAGGWGGEQDVETAAANGNAPSGLTATATKVNIDLKWNPPNLGSVNFYEVWRGTCPTTKGATCTIGNSSPKIIATTGPSGNNCDGGFMFCDTTTKNGVLYLYFVEASITYPPIDNTAQPSAHSGPSNKVTASR